MSETEALDIKGIKKYFGEKLSMTFEEVVSEIIKDPTVSSWLKYQIRFLNSRDPMRDPIWALNEINILDELFKLKLEETTRCYIEEHDVIE